MRKLVSFVFKMMASVVILIIISNVVVMLVDVLTVVNRVEAVVDLVEASVMRDNYLSDDARQVYTDALAEIQSMSDFCTNIELDSSNELATVRNYGDFATFTVDMEFETTFLFWSGVGNLNTISNSVKAYDVNIDKEYTVPCLRYLKYED